MSFFVRNTAVDSGANFATKATMLEWRVIVHVLIIQKHTVESVIVYTKSKICSPPQTNEHVLVEMPPANSLQRKRNQDIRLIQEASLSFQYCKLDSTHHGIDEYLNIRPDVLTHAVSFVWFCLHT